VASKPKKKSLAQRVSADPKLRAKYLKNPGLRSKLPDRLLTPELRKVRAANTYAKTPITPGSSVTNSQLARDIQSAQTVRYGPAETALKQQAIGTAQTGQAIGDWYGSYQRELQQHATNTQAINQAANASNLALQQGITGIGQQQAAGLQAGANQDAAQRGTTAANLGPEATQALAVRQQMAQGLGSQQVATGAAQSRYADTMANIVAPSQRIQAGTMNALDMRKVLGSALDLAREKGAYGEEYESQRVADEFKNILAGQALGLDVEKAKSAASTSAARIDIARGVDPVTGKKIVKPKSPTAKKTEADLAFFRQHGYYPPTGPPKAAGGRSASEVAAHRSKVKENTKTRTNITTAASDARYLKTQKVPIRDPKTNKPTGKTRNLSQKEIRATLRKRYKDADIANAAMDLAILGHISPENQRRLRARGIGVPKSWLPKAASGGTLADLAGGKTSISNKPPVPGLR
jgi:hypothetical protein